MCFGRRRPVEVLAGGFSTLFEEQLSRPCEALSHAIEPFNCFHGACHEAIGSTRLYRPPLQSIGLSDSYQVKI